MDEKKVLLSVKDLEVKFRVRGRILTAIRGISLDIYENESIAIVGESGSGKSVFTKTFAGMLDDNGFISNGSLIYNDETLADTKVSLGRTERAIIENSRKKLDEYAKLLNGADTKKAMIKLEAENRARYQLTDEESAEIEKEIDDLTFQRTELFNTRQTVESKDKERLSALAAEIENIDSRIKDLNAKKKQLLEAHKKAADSDTAYNEKFRAEMASLKADYAKQIEAPAPENTLARNEKLAKEIVLSIDRYNAVKRNKCKNKLLADLKKAMELGVDLDNEDQLNSVFSETTFRVRYVSETEDMLQGTCIVDLAQIKDNNDWTQIRGRRIATVFQDPMTSLNPIITIGKQISSIIIKHQQCSEVEARSRAIVLMKKVGIPNAEKRYDDYPFQYSGGMRQRIVIAIALSCQPKILICDEPTTALDVTIQAQILKLIKDLQKEFNYTIVFITHDLGVVANIADRVAVLYAGQIVELGTVEDIFYDPRHPYTWALLSSLPQLAQKNTKLYSITGTPPSLYNKIVGDPFAPRNPYCLKIDTLEDSPMFKVSDTHYAKTWLLDPRAPEIKKPEAIEDIHGKLIKAFNI